MLRGGLKFLKNVYFALSIDFLSAYFTPAFVVVEHSYVGWCLCCLLRHRSLTCQFEHPGKVRSGRCKSGFGKYIFHCGQVWPHFLCTVLMRQAGVVGWSKTMIEKQRVPGSSPAWKRKVFFQPCCDPHFNWELVALQEENMDAVNGIFGL